MGGGWARAEAAAPLSEPPSVGALAKGQQASAEEIISWCKERLAAYKYPRLVEFVEALPKGPTGKILKRELKS